MKSLKEKLINEANKKEIWYDRDLDTSVKTPEKKKVQNAIYKKLDETRVTGKMYRDSSWEGVKLVTKDVTDALEELNSKRTDGYQYEVSIAPDNGGYRTAQDGMSQWKQYKVELFKVHKNFRGDEDYPNAFMVGTLNCHAAGTIEDPFSMYDMSFCIGY